ncbi:MAG: FeoB-associated Cys-rich membrane protein [Oscillospiraceae bacterium]
MLNFIVANLSTIAVAGVVIAVIAAVITVRRLDKKAGKSSCGCTCADCPSKGRCH